MSENSDQKKGAIAQGEILHDSTNQQRWIIGSYIGTSDVGEMYKGALDDSATATDWSAIVHIESHGDGQLSPQMEFYVNNANSTDLCDWKRLMANIDEVPHLGMPALLGSGTHQCNDQKYRFVVLERHGTDLWRLFVKNGKRFPEHTVYKVALQILDVLEYIHSRACIHADIKGENLLLDLNTGNRVYLVNFGSTMHHTNSKDTYNSTIECMSRDTHAGDPTMRGDLESTLYNMIKWLCGALPWEKNLNDPYMVHQQKENAFSNAKAFLQECYKASDVPAPISEFMQLLASMESDDQPEYKEFSKILIEGISKLHHVPTGKLEFTVKRSKKPMTVITSNWRLIAPRNTTASTEQSVSVSGCSQENAVCRGASLNKDSMAKATAAPKKVTSTAELPKQDEPQVERTNNVSRSSTKAQTMDKSHSGPVIVSVHDYTCEESATETAEKTGKKVGAVRAKKTQAKSIDANGEARKTSQSVDKETSTRSKPPATDIPNNQSSDVDTSSSQSKSVKRKMKDVNELPSKCIKRNTISVNANNKQHDEHELDDSGIVVDGPSTSESSASSPSSNRNREVNESATRDTRLHDAVRSKSLRKVTALLENGAAINSRDADGNTPLHLAFLQKNKAIMDALLTAMENSSCYENVKNNVGLTTLHIASTRENNEVITNLLQSNAALADSVSDESSKWKGFTALHFAAHCKSLVAMKILVSASTEADRQRKNGNGETAFQMIDNQLENLLFMSDLLSLDYKYNNYDNFSNFHVACARDNPRTVEKFLEKGAPIDAPVYKDANICSEYAPIHFAVERKCVENVKILVKKNADLTKTNKKNMTPLHLALYTEYNGERNEIVDCLYEATKNKEANPKDKFELSYFHVACTRNDLDLVKRLLDENFDVNSKVTYIDRRFCNYTPLHFATLYENVDMVRLLIERGADVNACDSAHSGTPLHIAFDFGSEELIELLLSSGANPKAVTFADKQTMLNKLVDGYVKVHEDNEDAMLHYVEKLVMEFGVDVNAKDKDGDTVLHVACEQLSASAPVAELLLEFGADINAENDKGETPFMWALGKMNNWYRDDGDHLVVLYHHVKKLKALGIEISKKNEGCCERLIEKRKAWRIEVLDRDQLVCAEERRRKEIKRMKKVELVQDFSLYDLVMLEPERYDEVARLNLDAMATLISEFPIYGFLVKLKLREIKKNTPNPRAVM